MASVLDRAARLARGGKSVPGNLMLPTYASGRPVTKRWDANRAIRDGYEASTWVYAAVEAIASAAASVPWIGTRLNADGEYEPDRASPVATVIERPNPAMSRARVVHRAVQHLSLTGNALLTQIKAGGRTREMWPIDPRYVTPIPSRVEWIAGYRYQRGDVSFTLRPEDVIHLMYESPDDPYWGIAPLKAAARHVDTDIAAIDWNRLSMANRGAPDTVFHLGDVDQSEFDRARQVIHDRYTGTDKAHLPIVIAGESTRVETASRSQVEMDFIAGLELTRGAILSAFRVPGPVVGVFTDAPLSQENLRAAQRMFWSQTVIPVLRLLESAWSMAIVPEFGDPDRIGITYDISGIEAMRDDIAEKTATLVELTGSGVPLNAALRLLEFDLADVDGGDVGLVDATRVPLVDVAASL
ncbi:MAG: phage portal protein, partial [Desulfuromonadales bacterium]|nr:phage portal protein [Desulfuromonadales bacterium]